MIVGTVVSRCCVGAERTDDVDEYDIENVSRGGLPLRMRRSGEGVGDIDVA